METNDDTHHDTHHDTHRRSLDPGLVARLGTEHATGALGEVLAAHHLEDDDGLEVLARNWRLTVGELRGELDVVAVDAPRGLVAVCEVKARRDAGRFGGAVSAISPAKRARVRRLTAAFLREANLPFGRVRLDMIAVDLGRAPQLVHLEAAL